MLEPFQLPYVQRALVEVLILSVGAGLLGTWIVLRGLAFFTHGVGTAAFPGLVLAEGLGFAAALGALGSAAVFAIGVTTLAGRRRSGYDSLTALVLVGCLSIGVILASDVFRSAASVESLLFGSLLLISWQDTVIAAVAAVLAVTGSLVLGRRWMATGFDAEAARSLGVRSRAPEAVLLALIALATVSALSAVGALLTTALFVVPAATTRLWTARMRTWQIATVLVAGLEAAGGLWLSVQTDAPPGATIGVLSGAVFALAALARIAPRRHGAGPIVATLALLAVGITGCADNGGGAATAADGHGTADVVATTTQIADFVRAVGGDAVTVTQILKPNTDPHDYEPRPSDVNATARARIVFTNGDNLDHWMGKVLDASGSDAEVVDLGARVPVRRPGESSGAEASKFDPHWWHSPVDTKAAVKAIRDTLAKADPARTATYDANAEDYLARLAALQTGISACMAAVPAADRKLVTDHDAFGYFAETYGIDVVGAVIPSQTTQAQPSAGELAALSRVIRAERVRAIFPESSLNPKLAQAIAKQTGATADHTLYGDTLGPAGSTGDTYLKMEAANADAMVRGFTGGRHGCAISGI